MCVGACLWMGVGVGVGVCVCCVYVGGVGGGGQQQFKSAGFQVRVQIRNAPQMGGHWEYPAIKGWESSKEHFGFKSDSSSTGDDTLFSRHFLTALSRFGGPFRVDMNMFLKARRAQGFFGGRRAGGALSVRDARGSVDLREDALEHRQGHDDCHLQVRERIGGHCQSPLFSRLHLHLCWLRLFRPPPACVRVGTRDGSGWLLMFRLGCAARLQIKAPKKR